MKKLIESKEELLELSKITTLEKMKLYELYILELTTMNMILLWFTIK